MNISFVEIQNFRKLKGVRIDFAANTTLFAGANNSGKTSAMAALRLFLINSARFTLTDFTLSNWSKIAAIGTQWEKTTETPDFKVSLFQDWGPLLPSLDVWIETSNKEVHYISHLLPTLKWNGEAIGVRLRFEPDDLAVLHKDYLSARKMCQDTMAAANAKKGGKEPFNVTLWPSDLPDYLSHRNRLQTHFVIKGYLLDQSKQTPPRAGAAFPQSLAPEAESVGKNPLQGLIQINEIDAQRGFADASGGTETDEGDAQEVPGRRRLSDQLRRYYTRHIDPADLPDPTDIEALESVHQAQEKFNKKLDEGFADAFQELEGMGYPGLTDPKLSVLTKVEPLDGLRHASSVQYDVIAADKADRKAARLPEHSSGLGYQNLISIIFQLIGFRSHWMKVGKAKKRSQIDSQEAKPHPPLHLVLIEEPEAHLHAQVQQIFIRKAYEVLRHHDELGNKTTFVTQLVVSTHSSHVVHEANFSSLRYFRRLPVQGAGEAPISVVVNLKDVFGANDETKKFETRYIRTTHCDLFFADAIILVEGAAEKMFLPHFIRSHFDQAKFSLYQRYISILEISGSHAHRLKPLIEALALPTLIVTDLDAGSKPDEKRPSKSQPPERKQGMLSMNNTLGSWVPKQSDLDTLLDLDEQQKISQIDAFARVRVAYQTPVKVALAGAKDQHSEALASTFEDSLALTNIEIFRGLAGTGLIAKFREAIQSSVTVSELLNKFHPAVRDAEKAKFALDVIFAVDDPAKLEIPEYIKEGLVWLENELKHKDEQASGSVPVPL